jgi:hypothetical protein
MANTRDDDSRDNAQPASFNGVLGAITAAAVVPLILGFSFLSGYLFKLSCFTQLQIPGEFFNHAYFENVSVGTGFLKEAVFTLMKVLASYFLTLRSVLLAGSF